MGEKSKVIYGNKMSKSAIKKAERSKQKYIRKYGDDKMTDYPMATVPNQALGDIFGLQTIVSDETIGNNMALDTEKGIVIGNIRMGFGHYRIACALASAAHAMGYVPYWLDLNSFPETTCTKVISAQNDLYSLGSRVSQKSKLFNHFVWEPMNYEGFRKLSYNAADQMNAELMAKVYEKIPQDMPVITSHVWPAQAAIHAGMEHVVNAIPDNWPMALHYAEGSVHTVQTRYAYQGYRILNGMSKDKVCQPMPKDSLVYTGHYVDHELVSNIAKDCQARLDRQADGKPMRFLLTIGGAGAQKEIFAAIIEALLPAIYDNKAALYVNVGDYKGVWDALCEEIKGMSGVAQTHFENWEETRNFAQNAIDGDVTGIHGFYHSNIFEAVYCTNLLMRSSDVLVTKPSELAFYPIPKLFIPRVGGHEQWHAVHSAEIGDGTLECRDIPHVLQMIEMFMKEDYLLEEMCQSIIDNNKAGLYHGAYKAIELAVNNK